MNPKIEISYKTILHTIFILFLLWFLYSIRSIVSLLFVSLVLAAALNPLVDRLQHIKIPRILAILITYVFVIGMLSVFLSLIIPPLIVQTAFLADRLKVPFSQLPFVNLDTNTIISQFELISRNLVGLVRFIASATSNIITLIALLVLTFYFIYEKPKTNMYIERWSKGELQTKIKNFASRLEVVLGGWLRGQFVLMLIIGVMSYVGLLILGIDYALPLAILAGLLEFVPNLGPTLSAVPAVLSGLTISPAMAAGTLLLYIIIQQAENYLIVPQVMKKATGLHPLVSLVVLLIGGELYGFQGVLLAIPVFLFTKTFIEEFYLQ